MTWGPFSSETGGKPIIDLLQKRLFPIVREIQQLSLDVGDYKPGFFASFSRKVLSNLQERYRIVNKNFLESYHIYQTPDELFRDSGLDPEKDKQKIGEMLMDYFGTKKVVEPVFQQGFLLLEVAGRNLDRYFRFADQEISAFLSVLAITISVILAVLKSF